MWRKTHFKMTPNGKVCPGVEHLSKFQLFERWYQRLLNKAASQEKTKEDQRVLKQLKSKQKLVTMLRFRWASNGNLNKGDTQTMNDAILECSSLKRIICVICGRLPKIPVQLPQPFIKENADHLKLVGTSLDLFLNDDDGVRVPQDYSQYCHHPYCYFIRACKQDQQRDKEKQDKEKELEVPCIYSSGSEQGSSDE